LPENEIAADGPAPGSMDSPDGTLARRGEILARCRDGLLAYPELLRILKPLISPQEADDARLAARESLRMLGYAAACGVLLQVLIYGVPADRTTTPAVLYDLLKAQSIVIPLVLVSRFRVHLAGRTLMPLVGLLDFYRPAAASWHLADYGGPLFLTLVSYFLVGCLLDFGASAEPGRARPRARRWTLTILGAAMLAWSLYESVTIHHPMLFSAAASFLCSAWGYWIAPRLERRGSLDVPDAETLRLIALQRWGRFAIGRSLAILLGTLPFVIFLHTLQFKQRLAWPERPDSAATVHTGTGDHAKVWFWKPRGRLLRLADFGQNELYGVPRSEAIAVLAEAARSQESKYRALKTRLGAHRLRNEADFAKLFLVETKPRVYLLEPQSARANWLSSGMVWNPIVEDEIESDQLTGYTKDELTAKAANYFVRQVLLLSYGLLGFTILWRRGGDSRLARYLGCWLLGVAMAGSARYTMLFLPQIRYSVWHHALSLPWQNLFLAIATVVQVLNGTLLYLFVLFVPCAAIWILRCWPNRLNGERFQRLRRFLGWIKLALVSVGMILVF